MAYEQPNIQVYQEFVPTPDTAADVQYVGVVAPQYGIHSNVELGAYDPDLGLAAVEYPERQEAGSIIDTAKASVTMTDGILKYLSDTAAELTLTNGNQITSSKVLQGTGRDAALGIRDAQVGDVVRFKLSGDTAYTVAKITGFGTVADESDSESTSGGIGSVSLVSGTGSTLPTATGTYTGKVSDIFYVTIATGGTLGSGTGTVKAAVSTQNGSAGFPSLVFNGTGSLILGDTGITLGLPAGTYNTGAVFQFSATIGTDGVVKIIKIDKLISGAADTAVTELELGAVLNFKVNPASVTFAADTVAISAGLVENVALTSTTPTDYEVIGGTAYITYRERLLANTKAVGVATPEDYATVIGSISVDNPLGAMVNAAIATGGQNVYFVALEDDTVDGYAKAFEILAGTPEVYSVVLASVDAEVVTAAMAFVNAQSAPAVSNYRILWYGLDDDVNVARYTKTADDNTIFITAVNGTVTGLTGVNFENAGVVAGDILRTQYSTDSDGVVTYNEYTIKSVSENTLVVDAAFSMPVSIKAEVWEKLSDNSALIDYMVNEVSTANRRATAVYGDGITVGGIANAPAWVLAAAAAGMRAGSYPQAPLTNRTYDATANPVHNFTVAQLNKLAARGVWIIASDNNGVVFNRHQLTTDMSDLKMREQSYTTALDQLSTGVRAIFSVYHGVSNISDDLINQLMADTSAYLSRQVAVIPNVSVGSLLKSYSNLVIAQDEVAKDHLWMTVDYELQAPFNFATITQRVL